VTRKFLIACLLASTPAILPYYRSTNANLREEARQQQSPPPHSSTPQTQIPDEENPPEEDESVAPEKFVLNPLESERNVKVGDYYWRRKNYRAAANRYVRATKFNPSSAEAFFKLGEAEDKLKNKDAARVAFQRVLELAPDSKLAQEAKKRISSKS
jgi:tetratricopeptide (TPR) repeat protein